MSDTFDTNPDFILTFVLLFASLFILLICCFFIAVIQRRSRTLQELVQNEAVFIDDFPEDGDTQDAQGRFSRDELTNRVHASSRDEPSRAGSSRGLEGGSTRGITSFDAREGWRSNADLRASVRRNNVG
jgi:hypothetical protein